MIDFCRDYLTMNIKDNIFKQVYLNIVTEETETIKNKECSDSKKISDTGNAPIDDLTKENTVTIEEDSNDEVESEKLNEDDTDGWGEEFAEKISYLLEDLENFVYEIRNCQRGVYTGCKTKDQLSDYMINTLAANITTEAEEMKNE